MINSLLTRVFGSRNERLLKQLQRSVAKINALEPELEKLSDEALKAKTPEFQQRIQGGESLDKLLPEAFAVCREASRRVLGMRHYDVQLIGGMVLHLGKIAEMRTGEGKTLVATLAVYLNALEGKGVHVITVNDYLARRDAAWMGKIYTWLGLSVGVVYPGMPHSDKHEAYASDITYGTNNEFGFDYLRDNMAMSRADRYQRGLHFAIVDEVDSILIDEARTPLIISGPADESPELYIRVNRIVPRLIKQETEEGDGDFWVDEKGKQVHLSENGMQHAEELLREAGILKAEEDSLYGANNLSVVHHLNAALRAHAIYQRDVDYIVRDGEVIIVDEFTGRTLTGRRWSDGLHQAVEAKEGVPVQRENQTLASITFQNLFRMYKKLSGMTGTADTEAFEFQSIYGLEVIVIPTNRPTVRKDSPDQVFLNRNGKFNAVLADIQDCYARGQPALVGTTSIETSELLSEHLRKAGVPHEVLNAKQHEREAHIVAQAGRPKAITIATNMAGRGTDIVLGGSLEAEYEQLPEDATELDRVRLKRAWQLRHDEVKAAGGLHIVGTERHESRRIDNQLRGRSGRQGDPGSSRFYLSLEDNLMRIFASDWVQKAMKLIGMKEDDVIEDRLVSRQIEKAQRKVEAHNFDIRKNLLDFDDVNNDQRKVIYNQRDELLDAESVKDNIDGIRGDVVEDMVAKFVPPNSVDEQWDLQGLEQGACGGSGPVAAGQPLAAGNRGTRRRADHPPRAGSGGRAFRAEGSAAGRGHHALAGEAHHAHRARQELEGASGKHGLPAPGHPSARLCAEAAQAGIQEGSVRAVLRNAGEGQTRSGDHPGACAHPQRRGSGRAGSRGAPSGGSQGAAAAVPARGRRRLRRRRGSGAGAGRHAGRFRAGHDRPRRAQGRPQRSVPVRQWQEVQALPRPAELRIWRGGCRPAVHKCRAVRLLPACESSQAWSHA